MTHTPYDAGSTQIFNLLLLGCAPFHYAQVFDEFVLDFGILAFFLLESLNQNGSLHSHCEAGAGGYTSINIIH